MTARPRAPVRSTHPAHDPERARPARPRAGGQGAFQKGECGLDLVPRSPSRRLGPQEGTACTEEGSTPRHHCPDEGLGRSRGGLTSKIHLVGDGGRRPLLITPGQWGDAPQLIPVLERVRVARPGGGHPRTRPEQLGGDKACSSRRNRRYLRRRQIKHSRRTSGPIADAAAARAQAAQAYRLRRGHVQTVSYVVRRTVAGSSTVQQPGRVRPGKTGPARRAPAPRTPITCRTPRASSSASSSTSPRTTPTSSTRSCSFNWPGTSDRSAARWACPIRTASLRTSTTKRPRRTSRAACVTAERLRPRRRRLRPRPVHVRSASSAAPRCEGCVWETG